MTGESSSLHRLCVAVRRKLQLFYGKNGEFKQHLFDFTIPDVPKIMAWGQQFLCVGFKAEYVLYDVSFLNTWFYRKHHNKEVFVESIPSFFCEKDVLNAIFFLHWSAS